MRNESNISSFNGISHLCSFSMSAGNSVHVNRMTFSETEADKSITVEPHIIPNRGPYVYNQPKRYTRLFRSFVVNFACCLFYICLSCYLDYEQLMSLSLFERCVDSKDFTPLLHHKVFGD